MQDRLMRLRADVFQVQSLRRVAMAFGLLAWGACVVPAAAQGLVKSKSGDWEMRCETPAGASREQCALIQSIAAEDRPNVSLVVIVLKTADGKSRLLRVIAPLGVLLRASASRLTMSTSAARCSCAACQLAAWRRWSWMTSSSIS